LHVFQWSHSH